VRRSLELLLLLVPLAGLLLAGPGWAAEPAPADDADPAAAEDASEDASEGDEALRAEVGILAEELDALRTALAVPEEGGLESRYGLGPAASKVYSKERGLSIGGYGEVRLRDFVDDDEGETAVFDALRAVLYFGYKYSDRLVINSELEFEHAGTGGGGSVSTEFLTLDYLLHDNLNLRAGLVLVPMGFINEIHEPTFFFGNERPEVERNIIPSTWRENGAGVFGQLGERVQYRAYVVNGLEGAGFSASGLRGGRQKGSRALADDVAFVGRVDVEPLDGGLLGGAVYVGNSGQNATNSVCTADCSFDPGEAIVASTTETRELPSALTVIWEVHAQYRYRGASVRGLYAEARVGDADALSTALDLGSPVAERMIGGYAEVAYDVLPFLCDAEQMSLEPFFRYEHLNTQFDVPSGFTADRSKEFDLYVVGLSFEPHPQVVLKLDYRNFELEEGDRADEVQVGFGYVF